jgi:FKBP-type peptidyl-prolyl cis-trans isomerase SlpA
MSANGQTFTVYEVKDDSVILDGNHELAGKDLIFDITVVSID